MDQRLILVNDRDEIVGYEGRAECHVAEGILHRAFSIYLFDEENRLLLQRRSSKKTLWPGYWSNSCCSHPLEGGDLEDTLRRRLSEELGLTTPLSFAFKYQYQARYDATGSENELCSVYLGRHSGGEVRPSPDEVMDWRFASIDELSDELRRAPETFTPWFRIAWERIQSDHLSSLAEL